MWIPESAEQIEAAARRGELPEVPTFDAKADLPSANKNEDLAVDVAAMTPHGGVLLYGVGEDEHRRPTKPVPIRLAGARDRIDLIVQTSISEPPQIEVREFARPDDPSTGYLAIVVPPSSRAPHQVTVKGNLRYYGRGETGNRILTEGEVAALYRRRDEWEQDRSALLAEAVQAAPYAAHPDLGYVHAFTRPVIVDESMWECAEQKSGERGILTRRISEDASQFAATRTGYDPSVRGATWQRRGADAWQLTTVKRVDASDARSVRCVVEITVNIDGRGHLFCGRAADRIPANGRDEGRLIIFEEVIAGNLASFLAAVSRLYLEAGYHGQVDIGVAVTGLCGGFSSTIPQSGFYADGFSAEEYARTTRISAHELQDPVGVARQMLRHLLDATSGRDDYNPFK